MGGNVREDTKEEERRGGGEKRRRRWRRSRRREEEWVRCLALVMFGDIGMMVGMASYNHPLEH